MATRVGILLLTAVFCLTGFIGCVSADLYKMKEQEVVNLTRANDAIEMHNNKLIAEKKDLEAKAAEMKNESEELKDRIRKQGEEIASLNKRADRLDRERDDLKAQVEKLNGNIAELSRENLKLAGMTRPENLLRSLGERLADLQKQVDVLSGAKQEPNNKQAAAHDAETDGAKIANTSETAGKPKAVMISAGQKTEAVKPEQKSE